MSPTVESHRETEGIVSLEAIISSRARCEGSVGRAGGAPSSSESPSASGSGSRPMRTWTCFGCKEGHTAVCMSASTIASAPNWIQLAACIVWSSVCPQALLRSRPSLYCHLVSSRQQFFRCAETSIVCSSLVASRALKRRALSSAKTVANTVSTMAPGTWLCVTTTCRSSRIVVMGDRFLSPPAVADGCRKGPKTASTATASSLVSTPCSRRSRATVRE
mmetsp:Transcript_74466/g.131595  ORF Transcript_74466/g.131595 Transcript_74466/m.131595 type:complete len:219 (+) Transcript_74466:125-781(+)